MEVFDNKDELLVRYLLNELSKEENEELEDELAIQPELAERMQVVQMNLIDSFVLDEMSLNERARFKKGFFLFPENQTKVNAARAFHGSLQPQPKETHVSVAAARARSAPAWLKSLLRMPVPAIGAAALVLLIALIIGIIMVVRINRDEPGVSNSPQTRNENEHIPPPGNNNKNPGGPDSVLASTPPTDGSTHQSSNQEGAKLPPPRRNTVIASLAEIGWVGIGGSRGGNAREAATQPRLVKIQKNSDYVVLNVKLKPHEYFANNVACSVDVSDSKFQRLYPKGEGNYLRASVSPIEGQLPHQVSIKIPTSYLQEGTLYYFRVRETERITPFKVRFVP